MAIIIALHRCETIGDLTNHLPIDDVPVKHALPPLPPDAISLDIVDLMALATKLQCFIVPQEEDIELIPLIAFNSWAISYHQLEQGVITNNAALLGVALDRIARIRSGQMNFS